MCSPLNYAAFAAWNWVTILQVTSYCEDQVKFLWYSCIVCVGYVFFLERNCSIYGPLDNLNSLWKYTINLSYPTLSLFLITAMEELDGDTVRLSSRGRTAERDIVQVRTAYICWQRTVLNLSLLWSRSKFQFSTLPTILFIVVIGLKGVQLSF